MEQFLNVDLKFDKDFKLFLTSSKRVCTRFLHDFIPDLKNDNAQVVEFRDPQLLSEIDRLKSPILDVLAETSNRGRANIELQNYKQQHFDKRSVYYGSRSAAEGLARGKPYDNMHKIYVLALLNFIIFKQRPQYYTRFELLATDDVKLRLSDCLQFVFVEMGKFMAAYKSHKFNDLAGWINSLDNRGVWIYSITMTPYLTPEHRGLIARRDEVMEEAMGILQQMDRAKGHERIIAEAKEKAQRDQWARAEYKFDQGLAKGRQEGEQLGVAKGPSRGRTARRCKGPSRGRTARRCKGAARR